MNQLISKNLIGRGALSLLVVSGFVFSIGAFFILDDSTQTLFLEPEVKTSANIICENGLCYTNDDKGNFENILVQQGETISKIGQVSQNEDFTNLKLVKSLPKVDSKQSGNKVSLFAEKDSYIREGLQNINEGSSDVLKIMGTGPTNNRVLVSFNQDEIENAIQSRTLISATLNLHVEGNNQNWGDGQLINLHKITTNWQEGIGQNDIKDLFIDSKGVTWSCAEQSHCSDSWNGGMFEQSPTDSVWISNQISEYWIKFDVTSDILDNNLSAENYGWIIMKSDEDSEGQINFASRESQTHVPELVLVFSNE